MSRESDEMDERQWWEQFTYNDVDDHGNYPGEPLPTFTHKYPHSTILVSNEFTSGEQPF